MTLSFPWPSAFFILLKINTRRHVVWILFGDLLEWTSAYRGHVGVTDQVHVYVTTCSLEISLKTQTESELVYHVPKDMECVVVSSNHNIRNHICKLVTVKLWEVLSPSHSPLYQIHSGPLVSCGNPTSDLVSDSTWPYGYRSSVWRKVSFFDVDLHHFHLPSTRPLSPPLNLVCVRCRFPQVLLRCLS